MVVLIPDGVADQLLVALRRAGRQEIGGVLMGECLSPGRFRIAELTIQTQGGSFATFLRNLQLVLAPLRRFFDRTAHDYRRFNYLGEWHSHPSFTPEPSEPDVSSMTELVNDPDVGATFVVLMIVRLGDNDALEGTVTVFVPGGEPFRGELIMEVPGA